MRIRRRRTATGTDEVTAAARAAAGGDVAAMERFAALTVLDVWRFCAGLVDPDAADDLTQATYERALPALPRFRGDASARTWLLAIARRVCADEIRTRTRRRRLTDELHTLAPTAGPGGDFTDQTALQTLVAGLPPERREAFVATQVIGMTYDEAAELLDCAVGTIRSRVARARAELRGSLGSVEAIEGMQPVAGDGAPGRARRRGRAGVTDGMETVGNFPAGPDDHACTGPIRSRPSTTPRKPP